MSGTHVYKQKRERKQIKFHFKKINIQFLKINIQGVPHVNNFSLRGLVVLTLPSPNKIC